MAAYADYAEVRMMREEDLKTTEHGRVEYLSGPQRELWAIRGTP
jgi:hypothetical protein